MSHGKQPGAIGSGDPSSITLPIEPKEVGWANILAPTFNEYQMHCVTTLLGVMPSTINREWSSSVITKAISALELWLEEDPLKPVSEERIIKSYGVIGEILQLEVPTPGALRVIADLLKEIPDVVWPLAVRDVLRDHQWNTLPKPAAFVRAAASYEGGAHSCVRLVEHTIKKLKAAR